MERVHETADYTGKTLFQRSWRWCFSAWQSQSLAGTKLVTRKLPRSNILLYMLIWIRNFWCVILLDWQVWSSLMLYRKILDAIEENDYDNLMKRAYVGRTKKLLTLPLAYSKSFSVSRTWSLSDFTRIQWLFPFCAYWLSSTSSPTVCTMLSPC